MDQNNILSDLINTLIKHRKNILLPIIKSIVTIAAIAAVLAPAIVIIYDHNKVFLSIGSIINYLSSEGLKDGVWSTALVVAVWSSFTGAAAAYFLSFVPWARDYKTRFFSKTESNIGLFLTNMRSTSDDHFVRTSEKIDEIQKLFTAHTNYIIGEYAVRQIEEQSHGLDCVYVVVNSLTYELDKSYGYSDVISRNVERGVKYFYILPDSDDSREEWSSLKERVSKYIIDREIQINIDDVLKVRYEPLSYTSLAAPGLAIYTANENTLYGNDIFAIKYLPEFGTNIKLRCEERFKEDRKAIRKIISDIRAKHGLITPAHASAY